MSEAPITGQPSPEIERAEQIVDELAQNVASFTSQLGAELVKTVALVKEELEDIWAEAQELSRQQPVSHS